MFVSFSLLVDVFHILASFRYFSLYYIASFVSLLYQFSEFTAFHTPYAEFVLHVASLDTSSCFITARYIASFFIVIFIAISTPLMR